MKTFEEILKLSNYTLAASLHARKFEDVLELTFMELGDGCFNMLKGRGFVINCEDWEAYRWVLYAKPKGKPLARQEVCAANETFLVSKYKIWVCMYLAVVEGEEE